MQQRKLGQEGLEVSAIGLGCMGMTFSYVPFPEKKDMITLMAKAVEQGPNFF
jgi:aryl-alcohol dehydrogenase-like predicted oxidoreductase